MRSSGMRQQGFGSGLAVDLGRAIYNNLTPPMVAGVPKLSRFQASVAPSGLKLSRFAGGWGSWSGIRASRLLCYRNLWGQGIGQLPG